MGIQAQLIALCGKRPRSLEHFPRSCLDIIWPLGHTLPLILAKIHMQGQSLSRMTIFALDLRNFHGAMETNRFSITHMQTPYPKDMKRVTIIKEHFTCNFSHLHMQYQL